MSNTRIAIRGYSKNLPASKKEFLWQLATINYCWKKLHVDRGPTFTSLNLNKTMDIIFWNL